MVYERIDGDFLGSTYLNQIKVLKLNGRQVRLRADYFFSGWNSSTRPQSTAFNEIRKSLRFTNYVWLSIVLVHLLILMD